MSERIARRLVVHGRVQGVFYRESMRREAERLGVAGWVRNLADATVEAHLEGAQDAIDALTDWAHHGPPDAAVDRVEMEPATPEGAAGFEKRPSL